MDIDLAEALFWSSIQLSSSGMVIAGPSGYLVLYKEEAMKKVILVTGGSRGIGAATVIQAAQQGYAVCVNYHKGEAQARALADKITGLGAEAMIYGADIGDEQQVVQMYQAIDKKLGRVTALVNNAGILEQQTRLEHLDAARLQRILTTNVIGSFICAREAVKRMSTKLGGLGGAIVNVSSGAARTGSPGEYVDYAASKGAVDTMTIGLAKEVAAEGIRVNCVRPGLIYTQMHASGGEPGRVDRLRDRIPMKRGGSSEDVANAILWLLSEQAAYSTGTFIDVTGGG